MPAVLEKWPIKPEKLRNSKAKSEKILSQMQINIINNSSTHVEATAPAPKKIERHQQHSIWMAGCGSKFRLLSLIEQKNESLQRCLWLFVPISNTTISVCCRIRFAPLSTLPSAPSTSI